MNVPLPAASDGRSRGLAAWLLRPYLDLGPLEMGPLHARGIDEYWRAFEGPQVPPFALQRTLPRAFRAQVVAESGWREFLVDDPRKLPAALRTERWAKVCGALERWEELSLERRRALVLLLHALCLYEPVLKLVPECNSRRLADDAVTVEITYWRASARYVLGLPARVADYGAADLSVFEAIALGVPDAVPAAFNAAIKVLVHKAKTGAAARELARWRGHAERALARAVTGLDRFHRELLTSRYYRAIGFLPQKRGARAAVVRLMDLAERHARRMRPATKAQELLFLENLHPVLESRTKEALWLRDRNLALARARQVIQIDAYDSKAWVELGGVHAAHKNWARAAEAYAVAAMLGPPASAIGRHMAGACLRRCGRPLLAGFFLKDALEVDSLGISPHVEIAELPAIGALTALKEWSLRSAGAPQVVSVGTRTNGERVAL